MNTYRQAQPSDKAMVPFEHVVIVASCLLARELTAPPKRVWLGGSTNFRTHGKALRIEIITRTFVMTPVAITAAC